MDPSWHMVSFCFISRLPWFPWFLGLLANPRGDWRCWESLCWAQMLTRLFPDLLRVPNMLVITQKCSIVPSPLWYSTDEHSGWHELVLRICFRAFECMLDAYYRSASGVQVWIHVFKARHWRSIHLAIIGLKELDDSSHCLVYFKKRPRILFPTGMSWWTVAQVDDAVSEASSSS